MMENMGQIGQKTFHLEILSPERIFFSGDATSVRLPISDGYIGILAGHMPLTAAICDGELTFVKDDGERVRCALTGGMVDITGGRVRVLCESVLLPEEIDEASERAAADAAALELSERQSERDYLLTKLALSRAMNNLRIKTKSRF